MISTALQETAAGEFVPLLEVDMEARMFGESWAHCDHLSSYIAKMVSHNRADSLLYANLFSSALNELLETAFRMHDAPGRFRCRILRQGATDRVELVIPCRPERMAFYLETVALGRDENAIETYSNMLFSEHVYDQRTGLLELAVDYAAMMDAAPVAGGGICLRADLALENEGR
jgi:hypothetical protein